MFGKQNPVVEEEIYDQKESLEDNLQTLFDVAKIEYNNIIEYLKNTVLKIFDEGEIFRGNVESRIFTNLRDFDILLQYSVLQLSFGDGKFIDERIQTIEGIAKHGSLPGLIEANIPHFHWTTFTQIKEWEAYKALDEVRELLKGLIKEFSQKLRNYQASSGDTLEDFERSVKHFLEVVLATSGEYKEINDSNPCLILDLINPKHEYYEEVPSNE